jgi:glycosyltransferase involved in cell wall biosynthesis
MTRTRNEVVVADVRVVSGVGGGPDKTILNSPRFLDGKGYRSLCVYLHPPGDLGFEELRRRAEQWRAPLIAVPDRGPWDIWVVTELLRICRREQVTVWHGHDYKSNALGLLLRPVHPMRLVTTVHGWVKHTRRTPIYYAVDRSCLRFYEQVICVSDDLVGKSLACGVSQSRCVLIENGVDTQEFARRRDRTSARKAIGLDPHRKLVGAVGRLSGEKAFDVLIRAADRLWKDGWDFDVVIAGEGDERGRLEALVRELGRADRVRLYGHVADTVPLYEALDVFALSSLREGLPNVVLEAMALEVPVVATRIAGVPRLVREGETGLLVSPGSAEELANGLARVLADAGLAGRLAAAGRREVENNYSFAVRMAKLRKLYDELLDRPADVSRVDGVDAPLVVVD